MLHKDQFPTRIVTPRTVVRQAIQEDLEQIASWPGYPPPYDGFNIPACQCPQCGSYWWKEIDDPIRCHYSVVLPQGDRVIGIHAFVRIDWTNAIVRNMGVFIHPDFCSQGYGKETLQPLLRAVLESGICTIRLDVIANNTRAIQCYEKCGMLKVGEHDNGRFYWMEISTLQQDSNPEKIVDQISDEGGTRCSRCSARLRR